MKIIKYNNYSDIDIEFENGYVSKNNTYQNFKKGQVRNYHKKRFPTCQTWMFIK